MAVVWLWRKQRDRNVPSALLHPAFCLAVICWILGFKADRFWADWGVPAVLVWLTLQFEALMEIEWARTAWHRATAGALLAVPLFLHSTNDLDRRYSASLNDAFLDGSNPGLQGWLPEPQGIFYTASMDFFYNTFYKNPQAEWRYVLGMEPALMKDADLNIFRRIQLSQYSVQAYEPWVVRMRPADRLEIACASRPDLAQLDWTNAVANIWIGRLPRAK